MKGRLIVRANPYFAVSQKDGTFEIKNLPAGDIEFVVYHEKSGYVTDAEVKGEKVNWPKGVMKVTIEAGDEPTDLGEIKLSGRSLTNDETSDSLTILTLSLPIALVVSTSGCGSARAKQAPSRT